jgi:hypothetical protein
MARCLILVVVILTLAACGGEPMPAAAPHRRNPHAPEHDCQAKT